MCFATLLFNHVASADCQAAVAGAAECTRITLTCFQFATPPSDRDLRARCLARPDLDGHQRGARDRRRMAEPAARTLWSFSMAAMKGSATRRSISRSSSWPGRPGLVPGLAAMVDKVSVGGEHPVREPVVAHERQTSLRPGTPPRPTSPDPSAASVRSPWIAGFGPLSIIAARASRWAVFSLPGWPGAGRSASPSGPCALNLSTQSRIVCEPTPPTQAAFVREPPS